MLSPPFYDAIPGDESGKRSYTCTGFRAQNVAGLRKWMIKRSGRPLREPDMTRSPNEELPSFRRCPSHHLRCRTDALRSRWRSEKDLRRRCLPDLGSEVRELPQHRRSQGRAGSRELRHHPGRRIRRSRGRFRGPEDITSFHPLRPHRGTHHASQRHEDDRGGTESRFRLDRRRPSRDEKFQGEEVGQTQVGP